MIRTEGIVLNEMKYKETSKILTVYTNELGKISIMAQGASKPKSRMIALTQSFSYSEFQLRRGRNFYYLNQGDLIDSFYSIRDNMERIVYGYYILELMDKSTPIEEKNEKIFMLLKKGLHTLATIDKDYLKLIVAYELKYISFLGYRPCLNNCVICSRKESSDYRFSNIYGGLICQECFHQDGSSKFMDSNTLDALNELMFAKFEDLENLNIDSDSLKIAHQLLVNYILYNIDRKEFKSLSLLYKLMD